MLHHHDNNKDTQATTASNSDTAIRHHHSHTHLNLNPTHVIDQIKTKVKRRHVSHKGASNISSDIVDGNINENIPTERTSEKRIQLNPPNVSLTKAYSQPNVSSPILTDTDSDARHDDKTNGENKSSVKINEPDQLDKDDKKSAPVRWDNFPILPDMENTSKKTKSKSKLNKELKTLPESVTQSDTKKRRQHVRRTVESPSKKQQNKKNKRDGLDNVDTHPYLTSFQIRDDDFKNIFDTLPADEQLIIAYPCIWRKDMVLHGRMFLSVNYLCFYTCFFKWEESLCIALKDITSVTQEKSSKVLCNAIKLRTNNGEQYIFASFTPREPIFINMFRVWQNALLETPLDHQQLRAVVAADQLNVDESSGESEESAGRGNTIGRSSDPYPQSESLSPVFSNGARESSTISLPSEGKEQLSYLSICPCESHLARSITDRSFSYGIDKLRELIFGDNVFSRAFHDSQKLTDLNFGEWHLNNETGKQERQVTYKTLTQSILGNNTIICTEKQILEAEIPHLLYVISTEVYNEGAKYTDAFYIATRYCMFQRDAKNCALRITMEVRYIKSINVLIRSLIEKNCNASLDEGLGDLVRRLEGQQSVTSHRKPNQKPTLVHKSQTQKTRTKDTPQEERRAEPAVEYVTSSNNQVSIKEGSISGKGVFYDLALFIGIFLLLLHMYLCYKLYFIDQLLHTSSDTCIDRCKKACLENIFRP